MKKPVNTLVNFVMRATSAAGDGPARTARGPVEHPLAPPPEEAGRLHRIALAVEGVAAELARLESLKLILEDLQEPISVEFEAQMQAVARAAELSHRLTSTRLRLSEKEASYAAAQEQLSEHQSKLELASAALDTQTAARHAAEVENADLRPALVNANLQVNAMTLRLLDGEGEVSSLTIENQGLKDQLEVVIELNGELSSKVEQARHDFAVANDQLADARKRGEAVQVRALGAERMIEDLNATLSLERDRTTELEGRAQAAQAAANRSIAALQVRDDERLVELSALKNRLGEAQTRCATLEEAREKNVTELHDLNAERGGLLRDLAARDVEVMQLRNRLQSLEAALDESRRRVADVDGARTVAVQRADGVAKQLTTVEGRAARSDLVVAQKASEAETLRTQNDELRKAFVSTTQDLQGVIVQLKSEIEMLRGALAAVQAIKHVSAEPSLASAAG